MMTVQMPGPVASYFTADQDANGDTVSRCFTEEAVVKDEGHTYSGRAAIREWKDDAAAKFQYTCEPLSCTNSDGRVIVTSRVTGNFPGSPVDLRYYFQLEGGKIASLEVLA